MARPDSRSYRFDKATHWTAGAARGFRPSGETLVIAPPMVARKVDLSMAGTRAALGPCRRLTWLEAATGEVYELNRFAAEPQGRIDAPAPLAIHVGPTRFWVVAPGLVRRYAAGTLQFLGEIEEPDLIAASGDGGDGLWLLTRQGRKGAAVAWLDCDGRRCRLPIPLDKPVRPVAIAADPARRRLAVLDKGDQAGWRLHIVDLKGCEAGVPLRFPRAAGEPAPRLIAADADGAFHIASGEKDAPLIAVSAEGIELSRRPLALPQAAWPLTGLLGAKPEPILAAADGLYQLAPAAAGARDVAPATATFVTPTLMSPPGTPAGWNRVEIDVVLPDGATLVVSAITSSSVTEAADVAKAFAASERAPASRIDALKGPLAGNPVHTRRYAGAGRQKLHMLLDGLPETYLWLRLDFECPPGSDPAVLAGLRIRYPDRSWLDELPAIYRDDEGSAVQLRQFLAPFEALYGGIDEIIDGLPARIDPDTADEARLPWLLGWLGFPPTAGLTPAVQRKLLKAAGGLLERRGTLGALREMLDIVTDGNARVEDGSESGGLWIAGAAAGRRLSARLGCTTRLMPRFGGGGFTAGARLGEDALADPCDTGRLLNGLCARISIRLALPLDGRAELEPIIDALLAMFVPAHCRMDLRIEAADGPAAAGRLGGGLRLAGNGDGDDRNARLAPPPGALLGRRSRAGRWRLPRRDPPSIIINGHAALNGDRRLA